MVEQRISSPQAAQPFGVRGAGLCAFCEAEGSWPGYVQDVVELDVDRDDLQLVIDGDEDEVAA